MKEIKIKITDEEYNRLLRIGTLDAVECGDKCIYGTDEEIIQFVGAYAIRCGIETGEAYWGEYNEEDYYIK